MTPYEDDGDDWDDEDDGGYGETCPDCCELLDDCLCDEDEERCERCDEWLDFCECEKAPPPHVHAWQPWGADPRFEVCGRCGEGRISRLQPVTREGGEHDA